MSASIAPQVVPRYSPHFLKTKSALQMLNCRHPSKQRRFIRAVLREIGFAGALLAREDDSGQLHLIDGHLRADIAPDAVLPVLILDVTEAEAEKILATLDPITGMAEIDESAFRSRGHTTRERCSSSSVIVRRGPELNRPSGIGTIKPLPA